MTTLLVTSIAPLVFYGRKRWEPWKMFAALMRRSIACFLNSNKKWKTTNIFQSCFVSFTHSFSRDLILSKIRRSRDGFHFFITFILYYAKLLSRRFLRKVSLFLLSFDLFSKSDLHFPKTKLFGKSRNSRLCLNSKISDDRFLFSRRKEVIKITK